MKIRLFGLRAWGGRGASDIDVGALPLSPPQPESLADVQEELDRSPVRSRVELFDLTRVEPALRDKVMHQDIP